ncbi:MAG: hypothetical protein ACRCV5_02665 [Afipia sp.]
MIFYILGPSNSANLRNGIRTHLPSVTLITSVEINFCTLLEKIAGCTFSVGKCYVITVGDVTFELMVESNNRTRWDTVTLPVNFNAVCVPIFSEAPILLGVDSDSGETYRDGKPAPSSPALSNGAEIHSEQRPLLRHPRIELWRRFFLTCLRPRKR